MRIIFLECKVFKDSADNIEIVDIIETLPEKTKILLVDDDSDLRLTLCEHLESRHFSVTSARNGSEALTLLRSGEHFDIVFTDLVMPPGPGGLEVLKAAKKAHPHTYVVVMTGYSSIETAIEAIRSGAFDYLTKPFKLVEIEIVANRIVEYLLLMEENKRLSAKLAFMNDRSSLTDSRLQKIEALLGSLVAKIAT